MGRGVCAFLGFAALGLAGGISAGSGIRVWFLEGRDWASDEEEGRRKEGMVRRLVVASFPSPLASAVESRGSEAKVRK